MAMTKKHDFHINQSYLCSLLLAAVGVYVDNPICMKICARVPGRRHEHTRDQVW